MQHAAVPADRPARPVITLITDFGLDDWYVAAVKAALLKHCAEAALVDVSHTVPPADCLRASILLERALASFPRGSVHLAVVDPGVGSDRRLLIVHLADSWVVCPDNGLISWSWHRLGPGQAYELTWRPADYSSTFHGRDILAPVAGMLASGMAAVELGRPISRPILLGPAPAPPGARTGQIIYCDHFGNAVTNLCAQAVSVPDSVVVRAAGRDLGPLRRTYADVPRGQALALIGSSGLLEIAIRDGSAAQVLGLRVGDPVHIAETAQPTPDRPTR